VTDGVDEVASRLYCNHHPGLEVSCSTKVLYTRLINPLNALQTHTDKHRHNDIYIKRLKVRIALYGLETHHRATERHLPYGITQPPTCYPTQVNTPTLTPAMQAGTRFTFTEEMEG